MLNIGQGCNLRNLIQHLQVTVTPIVNTFLLGYFIKKCLSILNSFIETNADIDFKSFHKILFYKFLLQDITVPAKIETVCPNIDFKQVWSNFNVPYIDPAVRNTFWKLCHDVIYVNYYLFHRRTSNVNTCPLCKQQ